MTTIVRLKINPDEPIIFKNAVPNYQNDIPEVEIVELDEYNQYNVLACYTNDFISTIEVKHD